MRFHCTHCQTYTDPQGLDYETGLCGECQEIGIVLNMSEHLGETMSYTIKIDEVFEGDLDDWEEEMFPFRGVDHSEQWKISNILEHCKKMGWEVDIKWRMDPPKRTIKVTLEVELDRDAKFQTWPGNDLINGGPMVVTASGRECCGITKAKILTVETP